MVQLKSKSGTSDIVFNKENNYETTLIAYDIVRIEAKNSKIIPVSNVLLPRVQELKDEYGNVTGSVIKKPTYKLESLYRCLVDTGIVVESIPEGYELEVSNYRNNALLHGTIMMDHYFTLSSSFKGSIYIILCNMAALPFIISQATIVAKIRLKKIIPNE